MKKKIFISLSLVITVLAVIYISFPQASAKSKYFKHVQSQKDKDKQELERVKKQVDDIRKKIIAENKKFRVGITWAIRQKISQITGDKPIPIKPKPAPRPVPVKPIPVVIIKPKPKPKPVIPKPKPQPKPKPVSGPDPNAREFNWLDAGMLTPIKHQGRCGSCWSFSAMATYEGVYKIVHKKDIDLSEQYIIDTAVAHGRDAGSCNGGSYALVFEFLKGYGGDLESKYPYKGKNQYTKSPRRTPYNAIQWGRVKDYKIPPVRMVKEALCKYGPLSASVKVTPAFQAYVGGIFDEHAKVRNKLDTNHAIVIVGWDDDKKSYLIKNSWGTGWGENGYMWIEYGCNNISRGASWIIIPK